MQASAATTFDLPHRDPVGPTRIVRVELKIVQGEERAVRLASAQRTGTILQEGFV